MDFLNDTSQFFTRSDAAARTDGGPGDLLPRESIVPPVPITIEDTGLDFGFLADLALKVFDATTKGCTTIELADKMKLATPIVDVLLEHLYREKMVESRGQVSFGNKRYSMLDRGWERKRQLFDFNRYAGPTPVSLESYTQMVRRQEEARETIDAQSVRAALAHLVLPDNTMEVLVLVANSRRSLFLTGPPGNGKTSLAKSLHLAHNSEIWIPYAIEVDGQIIKVFDPHNHEPVSVPDSGPYDERWIKVRQPLVIVGGELTIESMDLILSRSAGYYEAPFQMKSNGGMLIIDDFGRQRVEPHDLLNRWIIPMEDQVDYLTLHTGKKIEVPFKTLLIFATNLQAADLVDDAFLRRLGYRLRIDAPSKERYSVIFQQYAVSHGFSYDESLMELLFARYQSEQRPLSCCHPRDLIERCLDMCRAQDLGPTITAAMLERAWINYFGEEPPVRQAFPEAEALR